MKNVYEQMEDINARANIAAFLQKQALPTKEELKFMNTGKSRPYSRTAPKKPPKPKKDPCFIDAGELTEKQRERLTARIMKEISRPGKER